MAASLETHIQKSRKTTKKQKEKQTNKQKQRYQETRTCMAASLETNKHTNRKNNKQTQTKTTRATNLHGRKSRDSSGGSSARRRLSGPWGKSRWHHFHYLSSSSLFFFFYCWLKPPKVSFDYSDRCYRYHYFWSGMFTILTFPSGSLWSSSLWLLLATKLTSSTYQFSAI